MKKKIFAIFAATFLTFGVSFAETYIVHYTCPDGTKHRAMVLASSAEDAAASFQGVSASVVCKK